VDLPLAGLLAMPRTALLGRSVVSRAILTPTVQLARDIDASATFGGGGGDELFYRVPVLPVGADFIRRRGLHPRLFKILFDLAQMDRVSIWRAARVAIHDSILKSNHAPWRWDAQFIAQQPESAILNVGMLQGLLRNVDPQHQWMRSLDEVPPAKLSQIFSMALPTWEQPFAQADDPEHIEPLLSQPLAEVCLRIPTYVHMGNGCDRAIARQAFKTDVPRQSIERSTKGHITEFTKGIFTKNIAFARELLLEGVLIRERLLHKQALEETLFGGPTKSGVRSGGILDYISAEVWLKRWMDVDAELAA
jgi:asparagine synthase (glutamine-hydrolysing)